MPVLSRVNGRARHHGCGHDRDRDCDRDRDDAKTWARVVEYSFWQNEAQIKYRMLTPVHRIKVGFDHHIPTYLL